MRITNHANLSPTAWDAVARLLPAWGTLQQVVVWGQAQQPPVLLIETVAQDEFTHDVIANWRVATGTELALVFGAT